MFDLQPPRHISTLPDRYQFRPRSETTRWATGLNLSRDRVLWVRLSPHDSFGVRDQSVSLKRSRREHRLDRALTGGARVIEDNKMICEPAPELHGYIGAANDANDESVQSEMR